MSTKAKARYVLLFIIPQLLIYFLLQRVFATNEYNFLIPPDNWIPFIPEFIWVYHSLVPVIFFTAIILLKSRKNFFTCYFACVMAAIFLMAFYILFPSFYPREALSGDSASMWLVEATRIIDHANNTFPSSHVTFSWLMYLSAKCSKLVKRHRILVPTYWLWAALVTASTLLLKQHYIVDVLSGVILAYTTHYLSMKVVLYLRYEE